MSPRKNSQRRKLSKTEAKRFLASPKGQDWLARQIAEKRASRKKASGPAPWRLRQTKLPFHATINGEAVVVSRFTGALLFEYEGDEDARS